MRNICLMSSGGSESISPAQVYMATGTGNIRDGHFCITNQCCSEQEVDREADALIREVEEWRTAAKKELAKLNAKT